MNQLLSFVLMLTYAMILLCCCEGTSINLSPLGMVSVCPGGQVLFTCERVSGSILYWDVFVPHQDITRGGLVTDQGVLHPEFKIGFTEFNITHISGSSLTSEMLINNVTTEINGSMIYCSEDGNETNALMTAIKVMYKKSDDVLQRTTRSLNVTLVNHLLKVKNITVTLQWPREAGAVYAINVSSEISHNVPTNNYTRSHNTIITNLTISYDIQYNVSIVSSLCGVTTTKLLRYTTCDYPPIQLLHDGNTVVTGFDNPPVEGQNITYTCPSGFVLTGPNTSVCTGNREWEPDPEEVACIADCGVPLVNRNVKLSYSSTLVGSVLVLTCENEMSNINTGEQILNVTCHSNGSWIPDPAEFTCLGTGQAWGAPGTQNGSSDSIRIILGSVLGILIFVAVAIIMAISAILFLIKKGSLRPKRVNRLPDARLENSYHSYVENSAEQPEPVQQQDTMVYADIGPFSLKMRARNIVTLRPDDMDDRVEYALLNHSLEVQKPVIESNQDSIADDYLNLDTLLIQIQGAVTSRWYQLGEALEVNKDVLDKCTNYPPEESIVEILDQWLRNFSGQPKWRDVANALRKIGLQQLANDIEMIYETGKLPIQVNDDDDAQHMFVSTALELSQPEEEITRTTNSNNQDESAPPLPPKPLAGSDVPKKMSVPLRPPKYVAK